MKEKEVFYCPKINVPFFSISPNTSFIIRDNVYYFSYSANCLLKWFTCLSKVKMFFKRFEESQELVSFC